MHSHLFILQIAEPRIDDPAIDDPDTVVDAVVPVINTAYMVANMATDWIWIVWVENVSTHKKKLVAAWRRDIQSAIKDAIGHPLEIHLRTTCIG